MRRVGVMVVALLCVLSVGCRKETPPPSAESPTSAPAEAAPVATESDERYPVRVDGRWGYADAAGTLRIEAAYAEARPFSDGRAAFRSGGRWGFLDAAGRVRIAPAFDAVAGEGFRDGRASVMVDGRWGCIDRDGRWIVKAEHAAPVLFRDGLACVRADDGLWGYIDPAGAWAVRPAFVLASGFSEERAAVLVGGERIGRRTVGGRWGYIDPAGKSAVAPQYASAGAFVDGLAPVSLPGDPAGPPSRFAGYINPAGKIVIKPGPWGRGRPFVDGLAAVQHAETGLWGFIGHDGRRVVEPQYLQVRDFSDGLAAVEMSPAGDASKRLWGYIDREGRLAVEPLYDRAGDFHGARAGVVKDGLFLLITADGTAVFPQPAN